MSVSRAIDVGGRPRIVIALNSTWNLVNFRAGLIRSLLSEGLEVVAVAPRDDYVPQLIALGCRYVEVPMDSTGTHPGRDGLLLIRYLRLLRAERPICFLAFTAKPNIFGSIAAHTLRIPVINNIAGLGSAYSSRGLLNSLVTRLYRIALSKSHRVFFQNDQDRDQFVRSGTVNAAVAGRLPGSGVDLSRFHPCPLPSADTTTFLLIGRLLWDKGVREYVEAARKIRQRYASARFQILGMLCPENRRGVPGTVLDDWVKHGYVEYLGSSDDVRPFMAAADCIVLPSSYKEGVPRVLLEAAAMARPIITTQTPGCQDVVEHGYNGYLCEARDVVSLAERMDKFMNLDREHRSVMGSRGRMKVESEFDERIVINKYIQTILSLTGGADLGRKSECRDT